MDLINVFILVFGLLAVVVSLSLGLYFFRIKAPLSKPFALQCFGGAIAGFTTVLFSYTSVIGVYVDQSPAVVAAFRLIIFSALTGSDVYMWYKIKELENGETA